VIHPHLTAAAKRIHQEAIEEVQEDQKSQKEIASPTSQIIMTQLTTNFVDRRKIDCKAYPVLPTAPYKIAVPNQFTAYKNKIIPLHPKAWTMRISVSIH